MTEREKMLGGLLYDTSDKELIERRALAHKLCTEYNGTFETDTERRAAIMRELVPDAPKSAYFQGPIFFDYGNNISVGENFYANFNFTVLDCAKVNIGDNVFFGPNCSVVTAVHPLVHEERNIRKKADGTLYDLEYAKPITIGDNCWIASNVTIIGGVTIGSGCVIGAGSVVTRDVPENSLAVGNPCRVLRKITDRDRMIKA